MARLCEMGLLSISDPKFGILWIAPWGLPVGAPFSPGHCKVCGTPKKKKIQCTHLFPTCHGEARVCAFVSSCFEQSCPT